MPKLNNFLVFWSYTSGRGAFPVLVCLKFQRRLSQVLVINNVILLKHISRFVAWDGHGHLLWNSWSDHVSYSRPPEIVKDLCRDLNHAGYLKGVGCICQQTIIDTYSFLAFGKDYTAKIPVTAADLLNDRVLPFFKEQRVPVLRILKDRGTEFCGAPD